MKRTGLALLSIIISQLSYTQVWDMNYAISKEIKEARDIRPLADSLYNNEKYKEAIPIYEKIVRLNPTDYESVFNLGDCYNYASEFVKAKQYYLASLQSTDGDIVLQGLISIASVHSGKNELDSCFHYLFKAVDAGLKNSYLRGLVNEVAFDKIRGDKRYFIYMKKIRGEGFTGFNQYNPSPEQMKQGVKLMYSKIKELHPNPFRHFTQADFDEKVNSVFKKAVKLSAEEYYVLLNEIASMVGDVHTSVYPSEKSSIFKNSFSFRLWKFKDGLFIKSTRPENRSLLGAKVLSINNIPSEQALARMMRKFPQENESMSVYMATMYLHFPALLKIMGLSQNNISTKFTLQMTDKFIREMEITAMDTSGFINAMNTDNSFGVPEGKITGESNTTGNEPLWLKNKNKNYWYEIIGDGKCMYLQLNNPRNDPGNPWKEFINDVFRKINTDQKIERLVFDQRHNPGGWHYMAQNLLHAILQSEKINQPGHLYIINSRVTQSAGIYFTTLLENETYPIIIGEPAAAHPNIFNGVLGNHPPQALPGTDILFRISTNEAHFSDDFDTRHFIAPDIPMEMTYEEFISGKDPLLDMASNFPAEKGVMFFTDAGGRKMRIYFHWKRPSQTKAFEEKLRKSHR